MLPIISKCIKLYYYMYVFITVYLYNVYDVWIENITYRYTQLDRYIAMFKDSNN